MSTNWDEVGTKKVEQEQREEEKGKSMVIADIKKLERSKDTNVVKAEVNKLGPLGKGISYNNNYIYKNTTQI